MDSSLRDVPRCHCWIVLVIAACVPVVPRAASAALVNYEVSSGFQQAWTGTAGSLFLINSTDLYNYAAGGGTWGGLIGQTFSTVVNVYYIDADNLGQLVTDGGYITFAVPEPSTYAMALAGIACGGFSAWRRRKRA